LWQSVFLVDETGENHRPSASHWQTWLHNVVSSTPCPSVKTQDNSDNHMICIMQT
jgi:hypothetical protein